MRTDLPLTLLFCAALLAPAVDRVARPEVLQSARAELREPADMPRIATDVATLRAFPAAYERHFSDTMGLRDRLIRLRSAIQLLGFGVAPTNAVLPGADRWLFTTVDHSVPVYRGLRPLGEAGIERWREELARRRDFCRAIGARYVFAIAPNKESVYPERMPARLTRHGPTRLDEFVAALGGDPDLEIVDLRGALIAERAFDRPELGDFVFAPDGTHWTGRGAWAASVALLERLARFDPAFTPIARDEMVVGQFDAESDTWAGQLYLSDVLRRPAFGFGPAARRARASVDAEREWTYPFVRHQVPDPSLPRVFLLHDSFGPMLRILLGERCSELTSSWTPEFPTEQFVAARPDVVLEMRSERILTTPFPKWSEAAIPLPGEAFEKMSEVGSPGAMLSAAVGFGGARVSAVEDGALALDAEPGFDKLLLPEVSLPEQASAYLRVELTSPRETMLSVWYTTRTEREYRQNNVVRVPVAAGRNDLRFLLPVRGIAGRLLLAPGEPPGRYLVHAVEVRAGGG